MLRELMVLTALSGASASALLATGCSSGSAGGPYTLSGQKAQTENDQHTQSAKDTAGHPAAPQAPDDSHYVPPS